MVPKQSILDPLIVHLPDSAKFDFNITNETKATFFIHT